MNAAQPAKHLNRTEGVQTVATQATLSLQQDLAKQQADC